MSPITDNPLDPENFDTGYDPFSLSLQTIMEGVQLDWQPLISLEPDKYLIYKKESPDSAFVLSGEVHHPGSTYIDILDGENLTVNQTYWYYVLAEKNNQVTDTSIMQEYDISLYLSTDLFLTKASQGINLAWSLDSEHQPESYNIYRRDIHTEEFQIISTVSYPDSIYTDLIDGTGLTVNNSYVYYVTSNFNSIEVDTSMADTISLYLETNLSLAQEPNSIKLTWSLDSEHQPESYNIYRKDMDAEEFQILSSVPYTESIFSDEINGSDLMVNNSYIYYITSNFNSIEADTSMADTISLDFSINIASLRPRRQDGILGVKIDWEINSIHLPDSFQVYRSSSEIGEYVMKSEVSAFSYFDSMEESEMGNTVYYYILAVFNNDPTSVDLAEKEPVTIEFTIPGSYDNIQASIDNSLDGDSINVASNTYKSSEGTNTIADFLGKKIKLKCQGNIGECILDGDGFGPVVKFIVQEDSTTVLDGFTIINGASTTDGGGIVVNANPLIKNCIFINNTTTDDGGAIIIFRDTKPIIRGCQFFDNVAGREGGAIYCRKQSQPVIDNCTFFRNIATQDGGAIYVNEATPTIINCDFDNNQSNLDSGGAILIYTSTGFTIHNCNFINNSAHYGGAVSINSSQAIEFRQCRFEENKSILYGGAIYLNASSPSPIILQNCIFWKQLSTKGGALYINQSNIHISHCVLTGNRAEGQGDQHIGGGIYSTQEQSEIMIINSIFHENIGGNSSQVYFQPANIVSITYSDIWGGWEPTENNWNGVNNIDENPDFINPFDNDPDFHLQSNSPCTGTGEGGVDMGAYDGIYGEWE